MRIVDQWGQAFDSAIVGETGDRFGVRWQSRFIGGDTALDCLGSVCATIQSAVARFALPAHSKSRARSISLDPFRLQHEFGFLFQ